MEWANYREVWGETYDFGMYYLNSIKETVLSIILQILISALGAYGFTKIRWKGRDFVFLLYLATMMIPPQVMIISRFVVMRELKLYNTLHGIITMTMFSTYGVFLLRFATESGSIYSLVMAAAVSATLPLILIFLLGQRYIIEGIASGAVKE